MWANSVLAVLLAPAMASAAILPEALGDFEPKDIGPWLPADKAIFAEFGFEEGERVRYVTPDQRSVEISAARFEDPTGAFAAFQWLQPTEASDSAYGQRARQSGDRTLIQFGNYLVEMRGAEPVDEHVEVMLAFLPRIQMSADPPVLEYVPLENLVPNSQRHVLGPVTLEKLAAEIPPSVAAFRLGAEAQYAHYQSPAGDLRMLLFSYPTPQIARAQLEEFEKLPGVISKRAGPLVAAVVASPSADEAERLLAKVRYRAEITLHHRNLTRSETLWTLLTDIIFFSLILAVLMIVGGVLVASTRVLATRYAPQSIFATSEDSGIVRLDIDARRQRARPRVREATPTGSKNQAM